MSKMKFITTIMLQSIGLLIFLSHLHDFAYAKIKIVATIPNLASIAKEVGGEKVEVKSIVKGYQDPHFVDAKPSYILWLNKAELLIYNGLDLEIGWLPVLITGSRNSRISSANAPGHLNVSSLISNVLDIPNTRVDRSMGDIHPGGNPHYLLDPRNGIPIARGIAKRLKIIDPDNSDYYDVNSNNFISKLQDKIKRWEILIGPYRGMNIVTYHKSWIYFSNWAGFEESGYIEPKPGIPPTPSHIANLIRQMKDKNIKLIISESFYPHKTASLVAQKAGSQLLILPVMVNGEEGVNTFFDLFDKIVNDFLSQLDKSAKLSKSIYKKYCVLPRYYYL